MLPQSHSSADGSANEIGVQWQEVQQQLPPDYPEPRHSPLQDTKGANNASTESITEQRSEGSGSRNVKTKAIVHPPNNSNDSREIIPHSFSPTVAVYASADTQELIRLKGVYGGFCGLLRPFGERIHGKVVIRDSVGASKSWENFGINFIELRAEVISPFRDKHHLEYKNKDQVGDHEPTSDRMNKYQSHAAQTPLSTVDMVVERYLYDGGFLHSNKGDDSHPISTQQRSQSVMAAPYYIHFLRKLLANRPMLAHETFSHPVACVIAISSQNPAPIDTLRDLYSDTHQGNSKVPDWVGNEFLRYYVLVHDEEHDDITKSTALFEQMKRHFGLHCHLLRLKVAECSSTNEDCVEIPACTWLSAEEELRNNEYKGSRGQPFFCKHAKSSPDNNFNSDGLKSYLFEFDVAAIKTFIREMTTQSIVPFMEGRVAYWNDQVAARRRGISGRFMSLSKRWTGFGSTRGTKPSPTNTVTAAGNNSYSTQGFYLPDSPEAIMHRLAGYAFMLRDWKLSSSIYEILKTDFGDDKAWKYHAFVSEMLAISLLLTMPLAAPRLKLEAVDHALDAASYSYITRCANFPGAVRCLIVSAELLGTQSGSAAEGAGRWMTRLLELTIMSPLAQNLISERLSGSYTSQQGVGLEHVGSRRRKAAFWNLLAAEAWLSFGNLASAEARHCDAGQFYSSELTRNPLPLLSGMQSYWENVQRKMAISSGGPQDSVQKDPFPDDTETIVQEQTEKPRIGISGKLKRTSILDVPKSPPRIFHAVSHQEEIPGSFNDGFT